MEEIKWVLTTIYLIWIAVCDWRNCKISVRSLTLGVVGALMCMLVESVTGQKEMVEMLLGVLPGTLLLILAWVTKKVGYADGIVLILVGLLYGYAKTVFYLCMSILLLACTSGVLLTAKKVSRNTAIPYIPFLAIIFILQKVLFQ